jgi:predicted Zn-dependent protease
MLKVETVERARVLLQLFPSHPVTIFSTSLALIRQGCHQEAATALERGLQAIPGSTYLLGVLALARARQGRVADAERIDAELEKLSVRQYVPFIPRAQASEACGDMERAYKLMSGAVEEREPLCVPVLSSRRTDLLGDPRFQSLLRKMNLS